MMQDVRVEIWHELGERNWTPNDLAVHMGGNPKVQRLVLDFIMAIDDPSCHLGQETAADLARAFGTTPEFWLELEAAPPEVPR